MAFGDVIAHFKFLETLSGINCGDQWSFSEDGQYVVAYTCGGNPPERIECPQTGGVRRPLLPGSPDWWLQAFNVSTFGGPSQDELPGLPDEVCISFWLKVDNIGSCPQSDSGAIFWHHGKFNCQHSWIRLNDSGFVELMKFDCFTAPAQCVVVTGQTFVADSQWHYISLSRGASMIWHVFVDGMLDGVGSFSDFGVACGGVGNTFAMFSSPQSWWSWLRNEVGFCTDRQQGIGQFRVREGFITPGNDPDLVKSAVMGVGGLLAAVVVGGGLWWLLAKKSRKDK